MRITGGEACGIQLDVPIKNVRPATDFMRERIFNQINNSVHVRTALDIFAGTGAYGLECLSRYRSTITFLEQNANTLSFLKNNCQKVSKSMSCEMKDFVKIFPADAFRFDFGLIKDVDLIFFDPPYSYWENQKQNLQNLLLDLADKFSQAYLALELPAEVNLEESLPWTPIKPIAKRKRSGSPTIGLYHVHS